uniref:Gypsy retrotransposon integrase-like protein 1 n=1 Tax=Pygocentrus nattereri TaxID=42514 RepID=A0AAR2J3M5_PYGNA
VSLPALDSVTSMDSNSQHALPMDYSDSAEHVTLRRSGSPWQHQQTLAGLNQSVGELTNRQNNQSIQLTQIFAGLQSLTTNLQCHLHDQTVGSVSVASGHFFPICKPEPYDGNPNKCSGFILQCSVYFSNSPPSTDQSKIAFIISCLTGKALDWATASWSFLQTLSYSDFLCQLRLVFDHAHEGQSCGEQLLSLQQGSSSVSEYALRFRTLAAGSGWNEPALLTVFRDGLNSRVQSELACKDDGLKLDQLISLAIRIDQLLSRRNPSRGNRPNTSSRSVSQPALPLLPSTVLPVLPSASTTESPMSCDRTRLLSRALVLDMLITYQTLSLPVPALIDSGAEGNFICADLIQRLGVPTEELRTPLRALALDGKPLGCVPITLQTLPVTLQASALHSEEISFFVLPSTDFPLVLGFPWLERHDPVISWHSRELVSWSPYCFENCLFPGHITLSSTTIESPDSLNPVVIPPEYSDFLEVFSPVEATKLPPHRPYDCAIDLVEGAVLPKSRVYPLTLEEEKAMDAYVTEALAQGYIRPSKSPVGSGFFFIKKKDGGLRPCIDYRGLNDITKKYAYPLPLIPVALEQLRGASYFTKLDLRSAYNLVRIREGDEWKTAFTTTRGHYEYLVMSYGLSNAPSVFQAFMNDVFREFLNKFVIVFIDDILIFSPDFSSHVNHVRQVLLRLQENNLYAKAEKCEFHLQRVSFLGYVISSSGVLMSDDKVSAVTNWPKPGSVKELQRFLGFANFYRRFIRNFSSTAAPLTALLKGSPKKLSWSDSAQGAFDALKLAFSTAPILKHPDPEKPFVVEVDASNTGVGAVLSQRSGIPLKLHPVAFFSRKLSPAERNYGIGDRELLAVKLALEEWRHWLEGAAHPFTVLTDHKNLEYLKSAKRINSRQARWSLFFSRFDFSISFRPGQRNTKADALSRIFAVEEEESSDPERILPPTVQIAVIQWEFDEQIQQVNAHRTPPEGTPPGKLFVPPQFRNRLITWAHSSLTSGHPGETRTLQLLSARYWWDSLRSDVHSFVSSCPVCAQCKIPRTLPAGKLVPLPVPERPWSHIAIDFVTDLPPSNGFTSILTVVDRFSRGVKFIPFPSLPSALQTAQALFEHVFRSFGIPEDVLSDRGPQFTSRVWKAFFEHLGVTISLTSGYHPTCNGQCERVNQELGKFLRVYCRQYPSEWSQYLIWAEIAQNSLVNSTTGLTPFQCVLGYQPSLAPWTARSSGIPAVDDWMRRSEGVWEDTRRRISDILQRYKAQADRHRGDTPVCCPGDRVWLSTRDFRFEGACRKLLPKFIGPFKILSQVNDVTYKVGLPPQYRVNNSFHVSLLKPVVSGPLAEDDPIDVPPVSERMEDSSTYSVREILDSRRRGGNLQYLIDWEGYGLEERCWVAARDVLDPGLVADYHARRPNRPAPRPRGRPRGSLSGSSQAPRGSARARAQQSSSSAGPVVAPHSSSGVSVGRRRGRPRIRPAPVSSGGGSVSSDAVSLPALDSVTSMDSNSQHALPMDYSDSAEHVTLRRSGSPCF